METRMYRRDHTDKPSFRAAHEARLTRRARRARQIRRRRSVCSLALTAALAGGVMLMTAAGAPAQSETETLTVTTEQDVGVDRTTSGGAAAALRACLGTTARGTGHALVYGAGLGAINNEPSENNPVGGVEATLQDPAGDDTGADVEVDAECSLRMALHAANALGAVDPTTTNSPDGLAGTFPIRIAFAENVRTVKFNPERSGLAGGVDPSTETGTPLPPILGDNVTIDGCGDYEDAAGAPVPKPKPTPPAPCVTLDFGGTVNQQLSGSAVPSPSIAPELAVGLIAAADDTTITGMAFKGNIGTAILALPAPVGGTPAASGRLTVKNSWFGRTAPTNPTDVNNNELPQDDSPDVGIQLSGRNALIGGPALTDRNIFAAADVGVLIAGGRDSDIVGNYFGTDHRGVALPKGSKQLMTGVWLRGLGVPVNFYTDMVERASGQELVRDLPVTRLAVKNEIGALLETGSPAMSEGTHKCQAGCNVFAGIDGHAIEIGGPPLARIGNVGNVVDPGDVGDVDQVHLDQLTGLVPKVTVPDLTEANTVGVDGTEIASNRIGVDDLGAKATNDGAGIFIRNGSRETIVGGESLAEAGNVIANNDDGGVVLDGSSDLLSEAGAGLGTEISYNVGWDNGTALIDLGNDGVGNEADGPSGGIQAPQITSATTTQVSGTAAPDSDVEVYRVLPTNGYGDVDAHLGSTEAGGDGNWSLKVSVAPGRYVTATAFTGNEGGTSELAQNALVPKPPTAVVKTPDPEPAPHVDQTAPQVNDVLGQDPSEGPVVLKKAPKELTGSVVDESGVAQVKVALEIVKLDRRAKRAGPKGKGKASGKGRGKGKGKGKAPKCKFVHLSKGKMLKRPCDSPPYKLAETQATSDGATWNLPLSKKARKRLRPGRYLLHVATVDLKGNAETQTIPLRRKAKGEGKGKR